MEIGLPTPLLFLPVRWKMAIDSFTCVFSRAPQSCQGRKARWDCYPCFMRKPTEGEGMRWGSQLTGLDWNSGSPRPGVVLRPSLPAGGEALPSPQASEGRISTPQAHGRGRCPWWPLEWVAVVGFSLETLPITLETTAQMKQHEVLLSEKSSHVCLRRSQRC